MKMNRIDYGEITTLALMWLSIMTFVLMVCS